MNGVTYRWDDTTVRAAGDRRVAIAFAASLVFHALALATLRGLPAASQSFAESGVGAIPALQAVLAGPPLELQPMEPLLPEPMIDRVLLAPALLRPVETTFGRRQSPITSLPGGGPTRSGSSTPDVGVAVGTIADPAMLGSNYVGQLAERFPRPVQLAPRLVGAPVVVYPRAALESGIEGHFAAVVTVDLRGKVADAKLVVDDPLFGPVMLEALKDTQFAPAQHEGTPVPYWAIVDFMFTIGKPGATQSMAEAAPRNRYAAPPPARARAPKQGR